MTVNSQNCQAKVTVAIPVFNGETWLRRALTSVKEQTHGNLEVKISDNASTDQTPLICKEFVAADNRFQYTRHKQNIGAVGNFRQLAASAEAPFLVFLAADDWWEPDFLEKNVKALALHGSAVASISRVVFEDRGTRLRQSNGDFPIDGPKLNRLRTFLAAPTDNSRFYSLFRTAQIKQCLQSNVSFHAWDWYVMARSLFYGGHARVEEVLMHRETAPSDRYNSSVPRDNAGYLVPACFPVLPMSLEILKSLPLIDSVRLLPTLMRLNIMKHKEYMRFRYPDRIYTNVLSKIV